MSTHYTAVRSLPGCVICYIIVGLCCSHRAWSIEEPGPQVIFMERFPSEYMHELPAATRTVSFPEWGGQRLLDRFPCDAIIMDARILEGSNQGKNLDRVTNGIQDLIMSARLNVDVDSIQVPDDMGAVVMTELYLAKGDSILARITIIGDRFGVVRHYSSNRKRFCLDYITF